MVILGIVYFIINQSLYLQRHYDADYTKNLDIYKNYRLFIYINWRLNYMEIQIIDHNNSKHYLK
jgi:hypothetical protein